VTKTALEFNAKIIFIKKIINAIFVQVQTRKNLNLVLMKYLLVHSL